jgi:hypothetical protein
MRVQLTERQGENLRLAGLAVDELEMRSAAARRVTEASRESRRRLTERSRQLTEELANPYRGAGNQSADTAKGTATLREEQSKLTRQLAALERQDEETHERQTALIAALDPLRRTVEAILGHFGLTHEDLGIPYGEEVSRSEEKHIIRPGEKTIGGRNAQSNNPGQG